ncbi:MAG: hypothetical protein M1838_002013 [Thelocarpon superellum]|nr:MAG: hypothetical protein M1838_002013 [Thelocarpon superellum]
MSFTSPVGDRNDEMRFRHTSNARDDGPFAGYPAALRGNPTRMTTVDHSNDPRSSLQRRFTTESAKVPTMTPITQSLRPQMAEPLELSSSTLQKFQLLEKKRHEFEVLKEQRRRFEAEMQLIDLQQQREEQEIRQMTEALSQVNTSAGHQSEPATPPEYRDAGFPSSFSRPNRFSTSSLTSPPGLLTRSARSGSQLTSPASELAPSQQPSSKIPSRSVPGSRRNSDEDEPQAQAQPEPTPTNLESPVVPRSAASFNRNSMPAAGLNFRAGTDVAGQGPTLSLGQINTTRFLFGDDSSDGAPSKPEANTTTSPKVKSYLQMNATHENFPILYSLPMNTMSMPQDGPQLTSPKATIPPSDISNDATPNQARYNNRNSREINFSQFADATPSSTPAVTASNSTSQGPPPKLQSSYSTNDIPTVKNPGGLAGMGANNNAHAQQHFHSHNASLGRIPTNAVNNRHSREVSVGEVASAVREGQNLGYQPLQSALQANAPPFGPPLAASMTSPGAPLTAGSPPALSTYPPPGYFGGYGGLPPPMNVGMNINNVAVNEPMYQPHSPYGFQMYGYGQQRLYENQTRPIQSIQPQTQARRAADGDANRFANVKLESLKGEIYSLCKDQHGCRYLQKKLEDRNPEHIQLIFAETKEHVVELMTDPFGNYLCQKLLEYCNDEQRTALINNAAPQMVKIALNQHGTRALQKMIEFISTPEQVQTIIFALHDRVVELIQDLNGNHVIQKCLNRLTPEDAQFIFDAVGHNCVVVGTHRHGCCVLQRCIDHASGIQKGNLVRQISMNSFPLVQDPFGNYVVQYILDLGEPSYTEPLIRGFVGHVAALSKQKFSSNVIEKCLRTADPAMKQLLVEEMLQPNELERMLRDSYANYVIQTAMDFADNESKTRLVESIRPILPAIRSTPYGRRIQGKIQALDSRSGSSSGQITPNDASSPGQIPSGRQNPAPFHQRQTSNMAQNDFGGPNSGFGGFGHGGSAGTLDNGAPVAGAAPSHHVNHPSFTHLQQQHNPTPVQQQQPPYPAAYGRGSSAGGSYYF